MINYRNKYVEFEIDFGYPGKKIEINNSFNNRPDYEKHNVQTFLYTVIWNLDMFTQMCFVLQIHNDTDPCPHGYIYKKHIMTYKCTYKIRSTCRSLNNRPDYEKHNVQTFLYTVIWNLDIFTHMCFVLQIHN